MSVSEEYIDISGQKPLPVFYWLQVTGQALVSDFYQSGDRHLIVSENALNVLKNHNLSQAIITPVVP